jgi:hypothetical protein
VRGSPTKGEIPVLMFAVDIRRKAIEVALSVTSGAYQTSLLSYFTHRDLFPSLMKVCVLFPRDLTQAYVYSLFKILIPLPSRSNHLHFSDF